MNTWKTVPESYQQRVYNNTLATVKCQIHHAKNAKPAMFISVEAARVDNAIFLDYLTSEVALEESEIGSSYPKIQIDNNCTNDNLQFGMPGGRGNYEDDGNQTDERNAIPTASRRPHPSTELKRFDLGTGDVEGYEGEDGEHAEADADAEEDASKAEDKSTQNVEH